MEIVIREIPPEGRELHFEAVSDPWFSNSLRESLADLYRKGDKASADFSLIRTEETVDLRGRVQTPIHPVCSRCLKGFSQSFDVPIHLILAPLYGSERQQRFEKEIGEEPVREDLEFSYYEGESFNLDALIREQIILVLPMKPVCNEGCKGLCQHCGADLNKGLCDCTETHEDPRWAPLKAVKGRLKPKD